MTTERETIISAAEELLEELKSANTTKELRHAMFSFVAFFSVELKHFHKEKEKIN